MSGILSLFKQEAWKATYALASDALKAILIDCTLMTQSSKFKTITAATNASPTVLTVSATPPANGDRVTISGAIGNTAINGRFEVANLSGNTFQLINIISRAAINGNGVFSGTCYMWNLTTNQFLSHIDAAAIIATSGNLASKTFTLGVFSFAAFTWSAVTTGHTCAAVGFYDSTPSTDATRPLIVIDDGANGLPVTTNGGDITYTPNAAGLAEI